MSRIYTCSECSRRTTEPFIIKDQLLCAICAEDIRPDIVDKREKINYRRFGRREFDGHSYDFGKHSSR